MSHKEIIQEYKNKALLVLRDIATDQLESTENRIKAAETILEYATRQNDDAGDNTTTEAIGFYPSVASVDADAIYECIRKYSMNVDEALKAYST